MTYAQIRLFPLGPNPVLSAEVVFSNALPPLRVRQQIPIWLFRTLDGKCGTRCSWI